MGKSNFSVTCWRVTPTNPPSPGVTLWIVPPRSDAQKLRRIMHLRPHRLTDSDASYPDFEPHITLAAVPNDVDVEALKAAIPTSQKVLDVKFKSVDISDHYFRSVLIAISPSSELLALHKHVHATLKLEPRTPLYPHVSLCYITDKDAEHGERNAYYHQLESQGRIRHDQPGQVSLDCGDTADSHDWLGGFVGAEIWIADCTGPVGDWKILDKVVLSDE